MPLIRVSGSWAKWVVPRGGSEQMIGRSGKIVIDLGCDPWMGTGTKMGAKGIPLDV
jgi:hypothetical protein